MKIKVMRSITIRYAFYGALFGFLFPVVSTLWDLSAEQLPLTLENLLAAQINSPLHLVIDTAPFFLGLFAGFAGRRQEQLTRLNEQLAQERNQVVVDFEALQTSLEEQVFGRTEALAYRSLQLETAAQVSEAVGSLLDPDELVRQVVELIWQRFDYYYVGLFLVDESGEWTGEPGRWAVLRAGTGQAGQAMLEAGHKLEVGGESMIGRCVAEGQARIVLDAGEEAARFDNPLLPETRSEMALPLIARGQVIGALTVQSEREAAFSDEDISILQTMATQIANALQNARHFELLDRARAETNKRVQEVDCLSDIGHKMTEAPPVEEFLSWAAGRVPRAMQYPSECVVAIDCQGQTYGVAEAKTLPWQMVQSLRAGHDAAGSIYVAYTEEHSFLDEESALLGDVARRVSSYVERQRLFRETKARAEELATLNRVAGVVSSSLERQELLQGVLETVIEVMGFDSGLVSLHDEGTGRLYLAAQRGVPKPLVQKLEQQGLEGTLCEVVYQTGEALALSDIRQEAPVDVGGLVGLGLVAYLGTPVSYRGEPSGSLCFFDRSVRDLTAVDLSLLEALGQQVGVGVQNARLFEQIQRALADAEAARQEAQEALAEAEAVHRRYLQQEWRSFLEGPLAVQLRGFQDGPDGTVPVSDGPAFDREAAALAATNDGEEGGHRQLVVPIKLRDETIGTIDLSRDDDFGWSEDDLALAESFADQLALAIENARLFEQTQHRAHRERLTREITDKIRGQTDLDAILQTTVRELGRVLGTSRAAIRLGTEAELSTRPAG